MSVRTYRFGERHQLDPGPCPRCGGTKHRVNWIDLGNGAFDGEEAIPGTVECLNPDCDWGPGVKLGGKLAQLPVEPRAGTSTGAG